MESKQVRYLEEKVQAIERCMETNRKYRSQIVRYKEELGSKIKNLEEMLLYQKERKKMSVMSKFNDSSPHVAFYNYDTMCEPRPRIMYLMRMLEKSSRVTKEENMVMNKLINMSTSSEYSSSEDFDNFSCDKGSTQSFLSKRNNEADSTPGDQERNL